MPGQKDAQYWRDYRARKAGASPEGSGGEAQGSSPEVPVIKVDPSPVKRTGPALVDASVEVGSGPARRTEGKMRDAGWQRTDDRPGYRCGCEPGFPCIGHGIQAMSQKQIDAILASPAINAPGRRK